MDFRIRGLDPAPYAHLFGRSDGELAAAGARRRIADADNAFPDRVELRDAAIGESLLLLNHLHLAVDNPYRASHAIYVLEGSTTPYDRTGEIPAPLRHRTLALRAFDADDMMIEADLCEGSDSVALITRMLGDPATSYLHAHYARRGCFACRIDRA